MKKLFLLCFLMLIAFKAFSQIPMSAGGGLFFNSNFGNSVIADNKYNDFRHVNMFDNNSRTTYGFYAFFDIVYAEASIAFGFGENNYEYISRTLNDINMRERSTYSITIADISILGKYPLKLGSITLFPLVGFSYIMFFSRDTDDGEKDFDFNQFGLLFGAGLDYDITNKMFIRFSALFKINFASNYMNNLESKYSGWDTETNFGLGPVIKIGLGYRL